jgi:four helix bundle protein
VAVEELPYRRLAGWQKSYALAIKVMELAEEPQFTGRTDLARQMTRAAMSVPAIVAVGDGRGTRLDFASFLDRARGSLFELDNWLLACRDRGLLPDDRHSALQRDLLEVNAVLWSLRKSQRDSTDEPRRRSY